MLTARAKKYLASLERAEAVPTQVVEKSLLKAGAPCFPSWLDFQDRYAGYIEPLGNGDAAIWGLIHNDPLFVDAGKVVVDHIVDETDDEWFVTCADVHPSYSYELEASGKFLGSPAVSFDVKVERNALLVDFRSRGPTRLLLNVAGKPRLAELVRMEISKHLEAAASDEFSLYSMNDRYLVRVDAKTGEIVLAWERA